MDNLLRFFSDLGLRHGKRSSGQIKYGTAGFRTNSDELDFVVQRVGLLAVLRSKSLSGKIIGLMITASHNPEQDNGVKLVDPKGEMLESSWEEVATRLVNADDSDLPNVLLEIVTSQSISWSFNATVFLGRDTRPSSDRLAQATREAIIAIGGTFLDCDVITTPMLHFFVAEANAGNVLVPLKNQDYFNKLSTAFSYLNSLPASGNYTSTVYFDGANGVGGKILRDLTAPLSKHLTVTIFNDGAGRLNYMCGSDYVKINKKVPDDCPAGVDMRCVSVDGDADRLIYFYQDKERGVHVLDGDRIATLLAAYLMELLQATKLDLRLGLVQTSYANGASSDYITNTLKVPLACTETGVKHLHHKALEYDIGVYFEANGHGTVVYSDRTKSLVKATKENTSLSIDERNAADRLWGMIELTNEAVGDAISDFLLVETVLRAKSWSAKDWEACYTDLPNRLLKVTVKDRDAVTTTYAARRCLTPVGLQEEIDRLVALYPRGRAFVRASGTEDVVRIYSEAASQREADELGAKVSLAVFNLAEGVGEAPVI